MRRILLGATVGALLAIPAGFAVAQVTGDGEQSAGVPASDCPGAVDAMVAAGYDAPDVFHPSCPDPSVFGDVEPGIPVMDLAEACEAYAEEPGWCPSPAEVEAAQASDGGEG